MASIVKLTKRPLLDYGSADLKKLKLINSALSRRSMRKPTLRALALTGGKERSR